MLKSVILIFTTSITSSIADVTLYRYGDMGCATYTTTDTNTGAEGVDWIQYNLEPGDLEDCDQM